MRMSALVNISEIARRTHTADHSALNALHYAAPIAYYRQFALKKQDSAAAAAAAAAASIKNAESRVLCCFIALAKMGYRGTIATEDYLAMTIRRATGGKMADRTLRRALSALEEAQYIRKRKTGTGNRIESGGSWYSAQVNRIIFAPAILAIAGMSDKSYHRPKRPTVERTDNQKQPVKPAVSGLARVARKKTTPARPSSKPETIMKTEAQQGRVEPQNPCQSPPAQPMPEQKQRSEIAKTWDHCRRLLLSHLASVSASATVRAIAAVQTARNYPAALPAALPWNHSLPLLATMPTGYRRRFIAREILPDLETAAIAFLPISDPPPFADAATIAAAMTQQNAQRAARAAWSARIDAIFDELPPEIAAAHSGTRIALRFMPAVLYSGKMTLDQCPPDIVKFCEIYEYATRNNTAHREKQEI